MWSRSAGGTLRAMRGDHVVLFDHAGPARPRITRSAAVRRCLIAAGFSLFFTAVGVLAAVVARRSGLLPLVELCCISSLGAVAVLELRGATRDSRLPQRARRAPGHAAPAGAVTVWPQPAVTRSAKLATRSMVCSLPGRTEPDRRPAATVP
jgi:hypothetical protein